MRNAGLIANWRIVLSARGLAMAAHSTQLHQTPRTPIQRNSTNHTPPTKLHQHNTSKATPPQMNHNKTKVLKN